MIIRLSYDLDKSVLSFALMRADYEKKLELTLPKNLKGLKVAFQWDTLPGIIKLYKILNLVY